MMPIFASTRAPRCSMPVNIKAPPRAIGKLSASSPRLLMLITIWACPSSGYNDPKSAQAEFAEAHRLDPSLVPPK